nr:hypothetical protein [uncultured Moraxella sp.]
MKAQSPTPADLAKHWQKFPTLYAYFMQTRQKSLKVKVFIEFLKEKFG